VAETQAPDSELRILQEERQPEAAPSAEEISLEKADLERRLLLTLESAEATRLEFQSLNEEVNRLTGQMEQMQRLLELKERQIAALTAIQEAETAAPEPPAAPAARPAALTAANAAPVAPVAQAEPPAVVRVEAAAQPAATADRLQNWWLAVVVVGLLVAILVLLVLLWRRSPRRVQRGPGAIPDRERPYARQVAAYSMAGVGAAGATGTALDTDFAGSDAQRFLDELERSSYGGDPFGERHAEADAERPNEEFQISDADLAALGPDTRDEDIDRWTGDRADAGQGADEDEEINSILNDLAAELDEPDAEEAMREPVIRAGDELPGLDLPLDLDVLDGVEHETGGGAARRGTITDEVELTPIESAEEDDTEAMDLKLELARAYLEIGDVEGARDILGKVVESSMSGEQLEQARALLNALK